ncbi:MAG: hypothetical protein ACI9UT_000844 [Flavobacteriales bacterium]|jgi:hypothetical protein
MLNGHICHKSRRKSQHHISSVYLAAMALLAESYTGFRYQKKSLVWAVLFYADSSFSRNFQCVYQISHPKKLTDFSFEL